MIITFIISFQFWPSVCAQALNNKKKGSSRHDRAEEGAAKNENRFVDDIQILWIQIKVNEDMKKLDDESVFAFSPSFATLLSSSQLAFVSSQNAFAAATTLKSKTQQG